MSKVSSWIFCALLGLVATILYLPPVETIGFISDDWDLIQLSLNQSILLPLENHHYSFLMNVLFKGVAWGWVTPVTFHVISFCFHLINICLVYLICKRGFNYSSLSSLCIALFFAINAAGVEAIVWCCAIGYVVCSTWIFCGLYLLLSQTQKPMLSSKSIASLLSLLQILAFLSWDWGILFVPLLFAALYGLRSKGKNFKLLIPAALITLFVIVSKYAMGQSMGYEVNSIFRVVKNILISPFLGLFPQGDSTTLKIVSIVMTLLMMGLVWIWRHPLKMYLKKTPSQIPLMIGLWLICLLPMVLFGAAQSRYFYLASFFMGGFVVFSLEFIASNIQFKFVLPLILIVFYSTQSIWAYQKINHWQYAYNESQALQLAIQDVSKINDQPILIVNLSDRYGPANQVWSPFMWRRGHQQIGIPFSIAYTVGCPNPIPNHALENLHEIKARYLSHAIYEVVCHSNDGQWRYELVSIKDHEEK